MPGATAVDPAGKEARMPRTGTPRRPDRRARVRPVRGVRRSLLLLAALLLLGLPALAGCGDTVEGGHNEVHPEVETLYDEAIRTSLAEVPDSELVEIVLRHAEDGAPEWHSRVVTAGGTAYTLELAATTGDLLAPPEPAAEPASERTRVLLEKAKLLPEEAARKVTTPDFGKVTRVALGEREDRTVWVVEVTTIEEDHVRRSAVDAVTGETVQTGLLHRRG